MTNNYALIKQNQSDPSIGDVVNVCVWDGNRYDPETKTGWNPPEDVDLVMVDAGWGFGTGDIYEYATGDFYRIVAPNDEVIEE